MMKLHRLLFTLSMFISMPGIVSAAQAEISAQESVDGYISSLFEQVLELKSTYDVESDNFKQGIEFALTEFVDFGEVARGVMAKYGSGEQGASIDQFMRFTDIFKVNMVDFYGNALHAYNGEAYKFLDPRRPPRDPENATSVRMAIESDDGTSIEIQYIMFLNEERIWKLKNLYIEGVNLRRQYYSRFDNLMARNDYNVEKVIELWLEED